LQKIYEKQPLVAMQTAVLHHIKCSVGFIPPLNLNIIKWWDKSHPTDKK